MTTVRERVKGILVAVCLLALTVGPLACGGGGDTPQDESRIESLNDFHAVYGNMLEAFVTHETDEVVAWFRQRMVGDAVVEGDHMLYQFEKSTGRLLKERIRWSRTVPDQLPSGLLSKAEAEAVVGETSMADMLCYIAPNSHTMPLNPVPTNPCWVLCSGGCGIGKCMVVDGVLGTILGTALSSPDDTAFSGTGPASDAPCGGSWSSYRTNAADWFDLMGYSTDVLYWPTESEIEAHVKSTSTAMFYEIGHSQSTPGLLFTNDCIGGAYEATTADEVSTWIHHYTKMPFTFLASCYAMSGMGPETLSYAFRKGSLYGTAVVGYREMTTDPCYGPCWLSGYAYLFQDHLFDYLSQGWTVKDAFDQATLDFPPCAPCTAFVGDESFAVVPVVHRGWLPPRFHFVLRRIPEILDLPLPPDPLLRVHLEDAQAQTEAAKDAMDRGAPRTSMQETQQAVTNLEAAFEGGVDDAAELADALVGGVDLHVGDGITDAGFVVAAGNQSLEQARLLHAEAQDLVKAGDNVGAMVLFLEAWDHLEIALAGQQAEFPR